MGPDWDRPHPGERRPGRIGDSNERTLAHGTRVTFDAASTAAMLRTYQQGRWRARTSGRPAPPKRREAALEQWTPRPSPLRMRAGSPRRPVACLSASQGIAATVPRLPHGVLRRHHPAAARAALGTRHRRSRAFPGRRVSRCSTHHPGRPSGRRSALHTALTSPRLAGGAIPAAHAHCRVERTALQQRPSPSPLVPRR